MAPEEQPAITPISNIETPNIDIPETKDYTQSLNEIAGNTGKTTDKINRLSDAIFALANTFKTQNSNQSINLFSMGQTGQQIPAASQVAASNFDSIGYIRQQFTI
jgi:hypothetical protein